MQIPIPSKAHHDQIRILTTAHVQRRHRFIGSAARTRSPVLTVSGAELRALAHSKYLSLAHAAALMAHSAADAPGSIDFQERPFVDAGHGAAYAWLGMLRLIDFCAEPGCMGAVARHLDSFDPRPDTAQYHLKHTRAWYESLRDECVHTWLEADLASDRAEVRGRRASSNPGAHLSDRERDALRSLAADVLDRIELFRDLPGSA